MIPVYIGWLGAQLLGMGTILHVLTGMSVTAGTLIGAVVVLAVVILGVKLVKKAVHRRGSSAQGH